MVLQLAKEKKLTSREAALEIARERVLKAMRSKK
jgi:hypothetical protein